MDDDAVFANRMTQRPVQLDVRELMVEKRTPGEAVKEVGKQ
jgi:hypothetical protein